MAKMQSLSNRRTQAQFYRENWGVRVDESEIKRLSEKQLLIKLETRLKRKRMYEAARLIQSYARRLICRNRFSELL